MSQPSIAIIGAGIAGSTLARCLKRHGIPVVVYDQAKAPPRYNYAITLDVNSYKPLARLLGVDEINFRKQTAADTPIGGHGRLTYSSFSPTHKPSSVITSPSTSSQESENFRAHRSRLEQFLREGLDVKWNHLVESIEDDTRPRIHFKDGSSIQHDHIIAADGVHSTTRKALLTTNKNSNSDDGDPHLTILPYIAINGKRRLPRATFEQLFAPAFGDSHVLDFLTTEGVLLHMDVFDQTPDTVSVNWIYSRKPRSDQATDELYKPNRPLASATEIPDVFYEEVDSVIQLLEQTSSSTSSSPASPAAWREVFDPEKLRSERKLSWLMRTSHVPLETLQRLAETQNVTLIGDAVHAQPILGGSGANAAIRDGMTLAEHIQRQGGRGMTEISGWMARQYDGWTSAVAESERAIERMHSQATMVESTSDWTVVTTQPCP